MFYFLPADIVTQILNFGLPAPIDVQIDGHEYRRQSRSSPTSMLNQMRQVPGIADLRIQQPFDQPKLHIDVDRTKARAGRLHPARRGQQPAGLAQRQLPDHADVLAQSAERRQLQPGHPDPAVRHSVAAGSAEHADHRSGTDAAGDPRRRQRPSAAAPSMAVVIHYNIQPRRSISIGSVQGRDLGGVGRDIDAHRRCATARACRAAARSRRPRPGRDHAHLLSSACSAGLAFAIVLVYLLIVVNFQSWLDPFIIITALPAALAGIVLFLFFTHTTLSVPALMGAIMCMGVATANSILVVAFRQGAAGRARQTRVEAAIEAGFTRFRPVLMTALAMIIGMVPMALGLGEGGEQNAPLGRAVIGGLLLRDRGDAVLRARRIQPAAWTSQAGWQRIGNVITEMTPVHA